MRPTLTLPLFGEIFIASFVGLEIVNVRTMRGMSKIMRTLGSLAGVMTTTLYKGPIIKNIWTPPNHLQGSSSVHESWVKGSLLSVGSCIIWSISYIMQAYSLRRYPTPLSLTTWKCFMGAVQSGAFALCVEHKLSDWAIGFNINLWSSIYRGLVIFGIIIFVQLRCAQQKGHVFVTMFNPLSTIMVVVSTYFVLGKKLHVGSLLRGVIVILGLYLLLWAKEEDNTNMAEEEAEAEAP